MCKKQPKHHDVAGDNTEIKIIMTTASKHGWRATKFGLSPNATIVLANGDRIVRASFDSKKHTWVFVEGTKVTKSFRRWANSVGIPTK